MRRGCEGWGIIRVGQRYKFVAKPPHALKVVPRSYYEQSDGSGRRAEEGYVVEADDGWKALVDVDELEVMQRAVRRGSGRLS